jgi:hypothetical protein
MGDVPDGRDPIVVLSSPYAPHGTAFDARAFRCVEPECMHLEIKSWRNRTPDDLVMHKYGPERSPYQHGTVLIIVGRSGGAVEILRQRMDADPLQFEGPR